MMKLVTGMSPLLVSMVVYIVQGVQVFRRQTAVQTVGSRNSLDHESLSTTKVWSNNFALWHSSQSTSRSTCVSLEHGLIAETALLRFEKAEFQQSAATDSSACAVSTREVYVSSLDIAMVAPQVSFSPWLDSLPRFTVQITDLKRIRQLVLQLHTWVAACPWPAWVRTFQLMFCAMEAIGDWGPSRDRFSLVRKIWLGFDVVRRFRLQQFVWRTDIRINIVLTTLWSTYVGLFAGLASMTAFLMTHLETALTTLLDHSLHAWLVEASACSNLIRAALRLPCMLTCRG